MGKANNNSTRREFLRHAAGWGVSIATGLALSGDSDNTSQIIQPTQQPTEHSNQWAFLEDRPIIDVPLPVKLIETSYIPLGQQYETSFENLPNQTLVSSIKRDIKLEARTRGFSPRNSIGFVYRQIFGIPDDLEHASSLMAHCKKAEEVLYESFPDLEKLNIKWTILKKGDNYETDFNGRGFLGYGYFDVVTYGIKSLMNDEKIERKMARMNQGGLHLNQDIANTPEKEYLMFISASPGAVFSPFSELIPALFSKVERKYEQETSNASTYLAAEAFSEAVAHVLGLKLCDELKIPGGKDILAKHLSMLASLDHGPYRLVPQALNWVQTNGVQAAYKLYRESPGKFMEAIGEYK
ncbi:hypothetical protein ACFL0W_04045 [Nanoarchaeota archaeon]